MTGCLGCLALRLRGRGVGVGYRRRIDGDRFFDLIGVVLRPVFQINRLCTRVRDRGISEDLKPRCCSFNIWIMLDACEAPHH